MLVGHVIIQKCRCNVLQATTLHFAGSVFCGIFEVDVLPVSQDVDPVLPNLVRTRAQLVRAKVDVLATVRPEVGRPLLVPPDADVLLAVGVGAQAGPGLPVLDQARHPGVGHLASRARPRLLVLGHQVKSVLVHQAEVGVVLVILWPGENILPWKP